MNTPAPEEVVNALLEAFEARDFEGARTLLSDAAFSYQSPIESFTSADAFISNISRVGPILERIERCKTFVNGNDVCSVLKIRTTMDTLKATPVVQLATVVDGKIVAIEAFFDATEYNRMIIPYV
jgi:limonene-1,2-epoxide hydrolase